MDDSFSRDESGGKNAGYPIAYSLQSCLVQLARLGGYLNRAGDAPPGNTVIWRGMSRLTDIEIGFQIGTKHVGN